MSAALKEKAPREIQDGIGQRWWLVEIALQRNGVSSTVYGVGKSETRAQVMARRRARRIAEWL